MIFELKNRGLNLGFFGILNNYIECARPQMELNKISKNDLNN